MDSKRKDQLADSSFQLKKGIKDQLKILDHMRITVDSDGDKVNKRTNQNVNIVLENCSQRDADIINITFFIRI